MVDNPTSNLSSPARSSAPEPINVTAVTEITYWKHVPSASGKGKGREVKDRQKRKYFELEMT